MRMLFGKVTVLKYDVALQIGLSSKYVETDAKEYFAYRIDTTLQR